MKRTGTVRETMVCGKELVEKVFSTVNPHSWDQAEKRLLEKIDRHQGHCPKCKMYPQEGWQDA